MLTGMQVRTAKGRDKEYKLADSGGLYLFVTAKGHRSWRMKYRFIAQRPGMIRALPWNEIKGVDWRSDDAAPEALWRVPASRMKLMLDLKNDAGFEHLVPVSPQAAAVLRAAHVLTGRGPLVLGTK